MTSSKTTPPMVLPVPSRRGGGGRRRRGCLSRLRYGLRPFGNFFPVRPLGKIPAQRRRRVARGGRG